MESPATRRRQRAHERPPAGRRRTAVAVPAAEQPPRSVRWALVGLMVLGSLSMWIANPVVWLVVTAHLQTSTQPRMGPYALMLGGIILTCVALGRGVSVVHRSYERRTGRTPTVHVIAPWRRSLRGGRSRKRETDGRLPVSLLDVIMVASVVLAVVSFTTWFVVAKPTPPGVGPGPAKH